MSYPSFCLADYANQLSQIYYSYEIWMCYSNLGGVPTPRWYELTHPSESARWTRPEVRDWIDENLLQPPTEYTVTIDVSGAGSTDPVVGSYSIVEGTLMTVTAFPAQGWVFNGWTLNGDAYTENPLSFQVLATMNLVAYFVEDVPPPPECVVDGDCPTDYVCVDGVCVYVEPPPSPECYFDADCPAGYVCLDGVCVLVEPPPDGVKEIVLDAEPKQVEILGQTILTACLSVDGVPVQDDQVRVLYRNKGEDWAPLSGGNLYTDEGGCISYVQPVDGSWFRNPPVDLIAQYPVTAGWEDPDLPVEALSNVVTLRLKGVFPPWVLAIPVIGLLWSKRRK